MRDTRNNLIMTRLISSTLLCGLLLVSFDSVYSSLWSDDSLDRAHTRSSLISSAWGEEPDQPPHAQEDPRLELRRIAIRNGSRASTLLNLSPGQERAIGWFYINESPDQPFCTGTVISFNTVLTARHCFEEDPEDPRDIRSLHYAVPSDSVSLGSLVPQQTFIFNQNNIYLSPTHDVAIVQLPNEPFRGLGIDPIPVNTYPLERDFAVNLVGSKVEMVGYGLTYHTGEERSRYYAAVSLDLITPEFLMVNGNNEQGICEGDSGGPLLAAGINGKVSIFGVESNGDPCCVGIDQIVRLDLSEVQDLLRYAGMPSPVRGPAACWGVSESRRCDGDILQYCGGDQVIEEDCSEYDLSCVYLTEEARFGCGVNTCARPEGYCADNNTVIHCERGVERILACGDGYQCGFLEGSSRPACLNRINANLICEERYADRVREASQARFLAEPNCQQRETNHLPWALLFVCALWLIRVRFNRSAL